MVDRRIWLGISIALSAACGSPKPERSHADVDGGSEGGLCVRCADAEGSTSEQANGDACSSCPEATCEETLHIGAVAHVEGDVKYDDVPPAGGDHNACWASWGVHTSPVADEHWVHNLEHGGIVYLYNCPSDCAAEVSAMAAFVDGRTQALLTPYPLLPKKFAVVSWGHRLVSDCFDQRVFEAFYSEHVDQAPESLTSYPPSGCHTES